MLERRACSGALLRCAALVTCIAGVLACTPCAEAPRSPEVVATKPTHEPAAPAAASGSTREAQDLNPPGPPGTIRVERREGKSVLAWNGTRDDTIQGYQVYKRVGGGAWQTAAFVKLHADDPQNRATYSYSERCEETCEFTVAAVDAQGRPGPKTSEIH